MTIRPATVDEAPQVVEMAARFIAQTAYASLLAGTTPERLSRVYDSLIAGGGVVLVAEGSDGRFDGFLALAVVEHPLSGGRCAVELGWWVEPRARCAHLGTELLIRGEAWARAEQLGDIKMVEPFGSPQIGRAYVAKGYEPVETVWRKTLGTV